MNYDLVIPHLVNMGGVNDEERYRCANEIYFHLRKSGHYEQLLQLVKNGPIYDGDVISKSRRNDLIRWKLAVRCCFKGEQGYTAASYYGWTVINTEKRFIEDMYYKKEIP